MKFEIGINNSKWEIEEIDKEQMEKESGNNYTMGLTVCIEQKIYLLKEQANIIKTLKHELAHAWLYEFGHNPDDESKYTNEDVCEIVASSNNFINKIVKIYEKVRK